MGERVVIVGASEKKQRYAYLAFRLLREHGHEVIPVSPNLAILEGVPVLSSLKEVQGPVDTVTMYVGPNISSGLRDDLMALKPKRIIFNPGSENPDLQKALDSSGIPTEEACTLVLLRTNQF